MRKILLTTIFLIGGMLYAKFSGIDAEQLIKMQKNGVPVIDIRTPQEWAERGVIDKAHLIMFFDANGKAHAREFLEKLSQIVKSKDKPFIIYCAHSNRTKAVGKWLSDRVGYKNVYELTGGIEYGWRDKGKEVKILKKN